MPRHHQSDSNNSMIYWGIGIAALWYFWSTGVITSVLNSITGQFSSLIPTSSVPTTNVQGQAVTTPQPGLWQVEPTAVYVNDVNVSSEDQYTT